MKDDGFVEKGGLQRYMGVYVFQGLNSGPLGEDIKVKKKCVEYMAN